MLGLNEKAWSPYAAGIIIGLLQIPAFLLVDTALGASSSFVTVSAFLASLVDTNAADISYFQKYLSSDKYFWQLALVIGIVLGAFASSRLSGLKRSGFSPIWTEVLGMRSLSSRIALGFVGGFLLLFGARLAGGCTSGHGISGGAQLALSAMIVIPALFAGGILTAATFRKN